MVRIGGFELHEPVPECEESYAFAALWPWVDVNNVGSMVLNGLGDLFRARELGAFSKPGLFYDFTRYRPTIDLQEGIRSLSVPNTTVRFAQREGQPDILMLRLMEPHAHAEYYVASVLKLLKAFKAKKYILLGSMYDAVPHTRPLLVSGYGMGEGAVQDVLKVGALPITYSGPSTIANLITKEAAESGIDAIVFIVSLPRYVVLDEDYFGKVRLMEVLNTLYGIPIDKEDFEKAMEQRNIIDEKLKDSPEIKAFIPQLETTYDLRVKAKEAERTSLTPDMEDIFWKTMGKDIGKA